jgi:phosphoribosyl-AMP cyclohydrolase / phosphoribosyl-ATP pyrophosphohydrolase
MVISSIDLMSGKAVQLRQGKEKVLENDNPYELAKDFNRYGEIAVIDLDAALGTGNNFLVIKELLKLGECRVGGGIKDIKKAKELISFGAKKIIIGSLAFENDAINHSFLSEICEAIGKERLIIAIDSINEEIVTKGWKHKTGLNLYETIPQIEKYCDEFLFTCVEKEGMMQGVKMDIVKKLKSISKNKIVIAGGVSTIDEIRDIAALGYDVQLGMALYTGKIKLDESFVESLNWKSDLIPTITQNYSGDVLMLAYSNKESIKKTFETGKMWYFSRSRNKLWMKGETSGHTQSVIKLRPDCDKDALLSIVEQKGVACHTGKYSCFSERKYNIYEMYEVLKDRIMNPTPNSYTATLTDEKLAEKIIEEANELIEAKQRNHVIWEAADLLYFITVLLAKKGIEVDEVFNELKRRRK